MKTVENTPSPPSKIIVFKEGPLYRFFTMATGGMYGSGEKKVIQTKTRLSVEKRSHQVYPVVGLISDPSYKCRKLKVKII